MKIDVLEPIELPDEVWNQADTIAALRERRIGYLFGLARKYAGASQTRIANVTGMDQAQVSRVCSGDRQIHAIDVLDRVASGLSMPDEARIRLGLAPRVRSSPSVSPSPSAAAAAGRLAAPGHMLAPTAPRPRTTPVRRAALPVPLTDLCGRDVETARVCGLLATRRLVTLAGPPGIGKTRLAIAVAERMAGALADGVAFVSLAEIDRPAHVVGAIARALEVTEVSDQPLADAVTRELAGKVMLLVLDNFEHVLDAAPFVAAMLAAAPRLHVLATSRERLRVSAEHVHPVPPLQLSDARDLPAGPESVQALIARSPALELFAVRAAEATGDFAVTPGNLRAVTELCRQLDGIPLAIELAAPRVGILSPDELLADLSRRLELCSDGPRNLPMRQQTLTAAIEWSFALLPGEDQALFSRLGVFVGGLTADAADAADAAPEQRAGGHSSIRQRLARLVDKNLVRAESDHESRTRYVLLETIRTYALERLTERGELEDARSRHAAYFATFVADAAAELGGPAQAVWLGRIEREYPNLRAAMEWHLGQRDVDRAAAIARGLEEFWATGRYIEEGRAWYDRVRAVDGGLGEYQRMVVTLSAGHLACWQADVRPARAFAEEGLAMARRLDDRARIAEALNLLGVLAEAAGLYDEARDDYEETLALKRELGDRRGVAIALCNRGETARRIGDFDTAAARLSEGLEASRDAGHVKMVAFCSVALGEVLIWQRKPRLAQPVIMAGLALSRQVGDRFIEANAVQKLGLLAGLEGRRSEELRLYADALDLRHELSYLEGIAESLEAIGPLTTDPHLAVTLLGAAAAARERAGLPVTPVWRPLLQASLDRLRAVLDESAFAASWDAGRTAALDQVVTRALSSLASIGAADM